MWTGLWRLAWRAAEPAWASRLDRTALALRSLCPWQPRPQRGSPCTPCLRCRCQGRLRLQFDQDSSTPTDAGKVSPGAWAAPAAAAGEKRSIAMERMLRSVR
jgi:hypothetical protein